MGIKLYRVRVKTPVRAYCKSCLHWPAVRELVKKRYGAAAKHLDAAFPRTSEALEEAKQLLGKPPYIYLLPNQVYSAVKRALRVPPGQPGGGPESLGGWFKDNAVVYTYSIKLPNGRQTVVNIELLPPGTPGVITSSMSLEPGTVLVIGGGRRKGFGKVIVEGEL